MFEPLTPLSDIAEICCCGALRGSPHQPACPRPLYRCSAAELERWRAEFEVRRDEQRTKEQNHE